MKPITILLLALPLAATPIQITGTAGIFGNGAEFLFSGSGLSVVSQTFDVVFGPVCTLGVPCDVSLTIPSDYNYCNWCWEGSSGSLNGVVATKISGALTFATSPVTITAADYNIPVAVNVTVSGTVVGNTVGRNQSGLYLIPVWNLQITGSGTGTLGFNGRPEVAWTNYSFTGTAAVIPEPASRLLFATAMSLLAVLGTVRKHRRRRAGGLIP